MAKRTSNEIIREAAEAATDRHALSMAAETERTMPPELATKTEDDPNYAGTSKVTLESLAKKVERLQDDIAYLRKLFGWPRE